MNRIFAFNLIFFQMTKGVCVGVFFSPPPRHDFQEVKDLHMKMGNFFQIISLLLNCIFLSS